MMTDKMAYKKIAYEPHPVSPERKRELNAQGFKIVDIAFKPDDAEPAQEVQQTEQEPVRRGRKPKDAE